jgi:hypothetical protein
MPHPEHAVDPMLSSGDGALILASLVAAAAERTQAAEPMPEKGTGSSLRRRVAPHSG